MFQVYKNRIFNIVILIIAFFEFYINKYILIDLIYGNLLNFTNLLAIVISVATFVSFFVKNSKSEFWGNFLITLNILVYITILYKISFSLFNFYKDADVLSILSIITSYLYIILPLSFYCILLHFAIKYSSFSTQKRRQDYGFFSFVYFIMYSLDFIVDNFYQNSITNSDIFLIEAVLLFLLLSTSWLRYRDKISFKLFFYLGLVLLFILKFISFVKIG
ncbi:hypothetical protein EDM00_07755 [Ornithobacterium rhinotracheale]|nr:hypothetical protein [Ornithobacterium rhinotracheale]